MTGQADTTAWLRPDEAALLLGTTPGNARVLAHRKHWRTQTDPHNPNRRRYHGDDVFDTLETRQQHAQPAALAQPPEPCNDLP